MKLQKPWTPLVARETEDGAHISVFGRDYTASSRSFLSSVISKGEEVLASPVRILLREDGEECILEGNFSHFLMEGADDAQADLLSCVESNFFVLNIASHIEFDGFCDVSLTVSPRGRSVAQCFGMEGMRKTDYRLDRLWMEIPLARKASRYFQFYPKMPTEDVLCTGGELSEYKALPFREQVFLTGENAGILFCTESEESWAPIGRENAIEMIPDQDTVILRIRFLDDEPSAWKKTESTRIDMTPQTFRFGWMATPVKPMPERLFDERAVHIDCYQKILADYEDFLSSPFEETGEVTYDRLARLGVNTLYIHEKWNDLQNSPVLTKKTAARLEEIVAECHKRNIRVIPYFGYEMSTLAPDYSAMCHDVWRFAGERGKSAGWYRQPPQRNIRICQKSVFSEYFTDGIDRLMGKYGFDGIYLDGTAYVWPCENGAHGCGFTDDAGVRHATYPVFGIRKTMKRLAEIVCGKYGGTINCHAGSAFNLPALAFATSLWDGEVFQSGFLHGRIDSLPDGYFRALYTGRNIGIPIFMLTYLNPPVWDFHMALSTALPFGILPKVNDAGEPLEIISRIWAVFDSFEIEGAAWYPYYSDEQPVKLSGDAAAVKVSVWRRDRKMLAVIASTDRATDSTITAAFPYPNLRDGLTGEKLSEDGDVSLCLHGFDFHLIVSEE